MIIAKKIKPHTNSRSPRTIFRLHNITGYGRKKRGRVQLRNRRASSTPARRHNIAIYTSHFVHEEVGNLKGWIYTKKAETHLTDEKPRRVQIKQSSILFTWVMRGRCGKCISQFWIFHFLPIDSMDSNHKLYFYNHLTIIVVIDR